MKKIILALGLWCGVATAEPLRVALTFDDSLKDHALIAAPMLEERGWRGVFNIITDKVGAGERYMTWEDIRGLLARGHEVTTHTMSHPLLDEVLLQKARIRMKQGRYAEAEELLAQLVNFYPTDILADDALMMQAELLENELKNPDKARECYEKLILDYSSSQYVERARKRYNELKTK